MWSKRMLCPTQTKKSALRPKAYQSDKLSLLGLGLSCDYRGEAARRIIRAG